MAILVLEDDYHMAERRVMEPFSRITVADARHKLLNDDVQVIDVRSPGEYAGGHVPGAINIPHMLIIQRQHEIARDKPLLFICEHGYRSAVACEFAAAAGFTQLSNVEGGTEAWVRAGYQTE